MQLIEIIKHVPIISTTGKVEREIRDIDFDSRNVEEGSLFIAVKGIQADGHAFIDKAIAKGAEAVVCESLPPALHEGVTYLEVENSQRELAVIAANFFGNPAQQLIMVGVTGTNGKTTSATLLHELFNRMGIKSGLVSTIAYMIGWEILHASHTTPDPIQLHRLFAEMVDVGCEYCFMEVSSHALIQHRVTGIPFKLAMFTNISHDHLDYHGNFQEYIRAKKLLFDHLGPRTIALVNADDKNSKVMVQNTRATVKRFGLKRMADYRARILENTIEGLLLEIGDEEVWFQILGSFNAYNLLMVYAAAVELGIEPREALRRMSGIGGVAGRFEVLRSKKGKTAIVDYSHTPDALKNILSTIQDINQHRGKVITVVGCGGNRDKEKRPKMGRIAGELSSQIILTSDNPRNENPGTIIQEMYAGIPASLRKNVLTIENRKEAIRTACMLSMTGDIILVAGKGHETYQEIAGKRYPFDDRKVLMEIFEESE